MSSGTDALLVALMALGIGPGDEVITSTYSFFATAGCVARLGATPRPRRHRSRHLQHRSRRRFAAALSRRARRRSCRSISTACAPTWTRSSRWRARRGVAVIEDAAQAIGATYKGRHGRVDGDGGLLLLLPEQEPRRVRRRRRSSRPTMRRWRTRSGCCAITAPSRSTFTSAIGGNFRLDALQAAVLRVKLPHLARWTDARRANAARYDGCSRSRPDADASTLPVAAAGPAPHLQPVRHARAAARPRARGLDGARHRHRDLLPGAVSPAGVLRARSATREGDFPDAEAAAESTLALPIYGELHRGATGDSRADARRRARHPHRQARQARMTRSRDRRGRSARGRHRRRLSRPATSSRSRARSSISPTRRRVERWRRERPTSSSTAPPTTTSRRGGRREVALAATRSPSWRWPVPPADTVPCSCTTARTSSSTGQPTAVHEADEPAASAPTACRSCSASGSRSRRPVRTSCASRACSAGRPAAAASTDRRRPCAPASPCASSPIGP